MADSKIKGQIIEAQKGCKMYMTVDPEGGLGNKMSKYISLLGHARRLGFKPVLRDNFLAELKSVFPYISTIGINSTR